MGYILMQPADDEESISATKVLKDTGECMFDLTSKGPCLLPINFGSRGCTDAERTFHSFVGEACCGRWAISQSRHFLWGSFFYWMCDCSAVKEILEYDGNISLVSRWAQELLGYHFAVVHRPARMMIDVDAITRRFGPRIAQHMMIAQVLQLRDKAARPDAYKAEHFTTAKSAKIPHPTDTPSANPIPVFTEGNIRKLHPLAPTTVPAVVPLAKVECIYTCPVMILHTEPSPQPIKSVPARAHEVLDATQVYWICIDDTIGSFQQWLSTADEQAFTWNIQNLFTSRNSQSIFQAAFPSTCSAFIPTNQLEAECLASNHLQGIDISYHAEACLIQPWFIRVIHLINSCYDKPANTLTHANIWIPTPIMNELPHSTSINSICKHLHHDFTFHLHKFNACHHGSAIAAERTLILIFPTTEAPSSPFQFYSSRSQSIPPANDILQPSLENSDITQSTALDASPATLMRQSHLKPHPDKGLYTVTTGTPAADSQQKEK